ncbi:hypothetical protein D6856_00430 [Butyrivibrio sp. XB500-5]|uniref:transglutaminase domain-containing protein n=1 Tax=Butyrivibrio sp. XB500-5 TaxID=2364880 RepID=UPI000EA96D06|nr:transglutaminase domain-containing protein [Butyrivibrio sp. XB500-5]RKM62629.1 hypothetical protein D6856_00430 [Butyrivibrio sp. XB500-5]
MLILVLILALVFGAVPESAISELGSTRNENSAYEQTQYDAGSDTESESETGSETETETYAETDYETYDNEYSGNTGTRFFYEIEEYEDNQDYEEYRDNQNYVEYENNQQEQNYEENAYQFSPKTGYEFGQNVVDGRYVFNSHVCSDRDVQMLGEDKREALFNLVDALMAGNDTFECPNKEALKWATRKQFIDYFFPPASNCIKPVSYNDGVAQIEYLIPVDEFLNRVNEFQYQIEDVLNTTVRPEYSDFEKALLLYDYVSQNYTYDYDALGLEDRSGLNPYRAFEAKTGICLELSGLYSYLLLQCGIQADFMRGGEGIVIETDRIGHQWSFARINGIDYHIDPTYSLHKPDKADDHTRLNFFLMSDDARQKRGKFDPAYYKMNAIKEDVNDNSMYKATDERYEELWHGYFVDLDTENNIVYYCEYKTNEVREFYYDD